MSDDDTRPATLADMLAQELDVLASCHDCNRHIVVSSTALARRLGAAMPVPAVSRRLYCRRCRSRDIATRPNWSVVYPMP